MVKFTEFDVEEAALDWFEELGYARVYAPNIAPDQLKKERGNYSEVILVKRLENAIDKINLDISQEAKTRCDKKNSNKYKSKSLCK